MSFETKISAGANQPNTIDLFPDPGQLLADLEVPDAAHFTLQTFEPAVESRPNRYQLLHLANHLFEARRTRERLAGVGLFGEPGWDMLLALYFLPARGEQVTASSLSLAAGAASATGVRHQEILRGSGLIERTPSGKDRRVKFVRLTRKGEAVVESCLVRIFSACRSMSQAMSLRG